MNPDPDEPLQPAPHGAWPAGPDDRDAPALNEAWHALDNLVQASGVDRLDGVSRMRLVRAIERRVRARRQFQIRLIAVAAGMLLVCGWWLGRSPQPGGLPEKPARQDVALAAPTATEPVRAAPMTVVDAQPSVIIAVPGPWSDPLHDDWELVHREAQDLELQWRRPSDRFAALRDQFEQVEQAWNERSL